jgi:predicted transcriptional regulator
MSKYRNKKSRSTKRHYRYTSKEVAELANVSVSYVKKIRAGVVDLKSHKAQQVLHIDEVLYDGSNKLLKEVERILHR